MKIKRGDGRNENPKEALIGEEETFSESRKGQEMENSHEKIKELGEIVPQMQHPNNSLSKERMREGEREKEGTEKVNMKLS